MSSSDIINLVIAIVSIIPTLVSVVILVVNIIKNKNWKLMMAIADEAMKTVEEYSKLHPGMSSDDKLNMAIESVKSGLAIAGIKVDAAAIKRVVGYIKQSIDWFNNMKK